MSGPVHALVAAPSRPAPSRQRPPARHPLSEPGDASEREADRAADVVARGGSVAGWSFSAKLAGATTAGALQRQPLDTPLTPAPKDDKDKLVAGAAAALDTKAGKELKEKVLSLPVVKPVADAVASPTGKKLLLGAAAAGVGGLAAAGKELPVQLPALPLDSIKEGLSAKVVARGPLNVPTTVGLVLSYTEPEAKGKRAPKEIGTITERAAGIRAERQRLERELDPARAAEDRRAEDEIIRLVVRRASFPGVLIPFEPGKPAEAAPVHPGPARSDQGKQEQEKKPDEGAPVQRERAGASTDGPTHVDDAAVRPALSGGRALDPATRHFMEARFGVDLAAVRIHDDATAAAGVSGLDAAAFTTGTDIVFGTGRFDPNTPQGRHLLAHELAHVLQQSRAAGPRHPPPEVSTEVSTFTTPTAKGTPPMTIWPKLLQRRPRPGRPGLRVLQRVIPLQYNSDTLSRSLQIQATGSTVTAPRPSASRGPPWRRSGSRPRSTPPTDSRTPTNPDTVDLGIHPQLAALERLVNPTADALPATTSWPGRAARDAADRATAHALRLVQAAGGAGAGHGAGDHRGGVRRQPQPDPGQGQPRPAGPVGRRPRLRPPRRRLFMGYLRHEGGPGRQGPDGDSGRLGLEGI